MGLPAVLVCGEVAQALNPNSFATDGYSTASLVNLPQSPNISLFNSDVRLGRNVDVGTGADGNCTVPGVAVIDIAVASCSGRATADGITSDITVNTASGAGSVTVASAAGIVIGDEIAIVYAQSATPTNRGRFHVARVTGVAGAVLSFAPGVPFAVAATEGAFVQRVPNYLNVTVTGTLSSAPWNGTTGGYLFGRAKGTVSGTGSVDMAARGFRGAATNGNPEDASGVVATGGGVGGQGGGAIACGDGVSALPGTNGSGGGGHGGGNGAAAAAGGPRGGGGGGGGGNGSVIGGRGGLGASNGTQGTLGGGGCHAGGGGGGGAANASLGNPSPVGLATMVPGGGAAAGAGGGTGSQDRNSTNGPGGTVAGGGAGERGGGSVWFSADTWNLPAAGQVVAPGGRGGAGGNGTAGAQQACEGGGGGGGGSGANGAAGGTVALVARAMSLNAMPGVAGGPGGALGAGGAGVSGSGCGSQSVGGNGGNGANGATGASGVTTVSWGDALLSSGSLAASQVGFVASGTLVSANLLAAPPDVDTIDLFEITATLPTSTTATVQFSQDGSTWVNNTGALATNTLIGGPNSIDLTSLNWAGRNFYYRVQLAGTGVNTPILDDATVRYCADATDYDGDSIGDACDADADGDGALAANDCNDLDSALIALVPYWADVDGDGWGDAASTVQKCQLTPPAGFVANDVDNCPAASNPLQADSDGDLVGDVCDVDLDGDTVNNDADNCPTVKNADQSDLDQDGEGDVCDADADGDGFDAVVDCDDFNADGSVVTEFYLDVDGDGSGDVAVTTSECSNAPPPGYALHFGDNCPSDANPDQSDLDADSLGDACDADQDGDGVDDVDDNCPRVANEDQADTDDDGQGDACVDDADGDGVLDEDDVCPDDADPEQEDLDDDGIGDACDDDVDGDGVTAALDCDDRDDAVADTHAYFVDADGDGVGDPGLASQLVCGEAPARGYALTDTDNCPGVYNPDQADQDANAVGDACEEPALVVVGDACGCLTPGGGWTPFGVLASAVAMLRRRPRLLEAHARDGR